MYDIASVVGGVVVEPPPLTSLRHWAKKPLGYGVTTVQNMCTFATPDVYASMWQKAACHPLPGHRWADMEPNGKLIVPSVQSSLHPPGLPLMTISGTK
jgi:hypothetical protein